MAAADKVPHADRAVRAARRCRPTVRSKCHRVDRPDMSVGAGVGIEPLSIPHVPALQQIAERKERLAVGGEGETPAGMLDMVLQLQCGYVPEEHALVCALRQRFAIRGKL